MTYSIYEQCERSIEQAVKTLELLRRRQRLSDENRRPIHRRRQTAAIAMQATFSELQDAFITPIDREDLWLLRQLAEAVTRAAEDVVLGLIRSRRQASEDADLPFLTAVITECQLLSLAFASFSAYPRSDALLRRLQALEQRHLQNEELDCTTNALIEVSNACFAAASGIRYVALRAT